MARYYDPTVGRFLSTDPVSLVSDYTYGNENPISYVDPNGLSGELALTGTIGVVLFIVDLATVTLGSYLVSTHEVVYYTSTVTPTSTSIDTSLTYASSGDDDTTSLPGVGGPSPNGKGPKKEKPQQNHHFLTNKSRTYTKVFKDIIKKYDLDLNGEWNIEKMAHQGRHPNAYHEFMLRKVKAIAGEAKNTEEFLKMFEEVKQTIIKNPEMLYKNYWKNLL